MAARSGNRQVGKPVAKSPSPTGGKRTSAAKKPANPPAKKKIGPSKPGQTPITFQPGGLHKSLGIADGQPIPPAKMAAAIAGKHGPKARKQALFAKNVLNRGN